MQSALVENSPTEQTGSNIPTNDNSVGKNFLGDTSAGAHSVGDNLSKKKFNERRLKG